MFKNNKIVKKEPNDMNEVHIYLEKKFWEWKIYKILLSW